MVIDQKTVLKAIVTFKLFNVEKLQNLSVGEIFWNIFQTFKSSQSLGR